MLFDIKQKLDDTSDVKGFFELQSNTTEEKTVFFLANKKSVNKF